MTEISGDDGLTQIPVDAGLESGGSEGDDGGGGAPLWMCTFADLVTLLMCFFVLLFAMSSTQQDTFKELVQSLKSALGIEQIPEAGTREGMVIHKIEAIQNNTNDQDLIEEIGGMVQKELNDIVSEVRELIMFNSLSGLVRVQENERGAVITISDIVLFPSGEATMTAKGFEILKKVAAVLKQFAYPVKIAGHTDTTPISTRQFPSNWELSVCRATEVVRFLIENGLDPRIITAEGFGEYRPVAGNDTVEGRSQNRRVEIIYDRDTIIRLLSDRRH